MSGESLWPLLGYAGAVLVLVGTIIGLSWVLGERHHQTATDEPYEGGIAPTGSARVRLSVKFYLIAMFFVIFDLEAVFLFAWAVAVRELGWAGFVEVLVFVAILMAALVYLWKLGALDLATARQERPEVKPRPAGREIERAA